MAEQMRNFRIGSQAKSALNHNMLCRMMPTRSQREEPQMMSLDAAIADYDEECRAWRAMEEELEDLRCAGVFR